MKSPLVKRSNVKVGMSLHSSECQSSHFSLKEVKRLKLCIALHGKPISELRDVTYHMGSHSVTCPALTPASKLLDLHTPDGWKAELI